MSILLPTVTEPPLTSDWLRGELDPRFSRAQVEIKAGSGTVPHGTLLAQVSSTTYAATAAAAGGNAGDGTLTLDATTPTLAGVKRGVYTATCITAAADGGVFRVENPDGDVIGDVAVGATFADDVKFVIADGASDFVAGDSFTITVVEATSATAGEYVPWDPTATDGSEDAKVICFYTTTVPAASNARVLAIKGSAIIVPNNLAWPDGVTADQKAAAVAALEARGIETRAAV